MGAGGGKRFCLSISFSGSRPSPLASTEHALASDPPGRSYEPLSLIERGGRKVEERNHTKGEEHSSTYRSTAFSPRPPIPLLTELEIPQRPVTEIPPLLL